MFRQSDKNKLEIIFNYIPHLSARLDAQRDAITAAKSFAVETAKTDAVERVDLRVILDSHRKNFEDQQAILNELGAAIGRLDHAVNGDNTKTGLRGTLAADFQAVVNSFNTVVQKLDSNNDSLNRLEIKFNESQHQMRGYLEGCFRDLKRDFLGPLQTQLNDIALVVSTLPWKKKRKKRAKR